MSTSACLRAFVAVSPPNPDPMTTTRCRGFGSAVASGVAFMPVTLVGPMPPVAAILSGIRHPPRLVAIRLLSGHQRFECLAQFGHGTRRVEGHVDDRGVDARVENLGLDLIGDRIR